MSSKVTLTIDNEGTIETYVVPMAKSTSVEYIKGTPEFQGRYWAGRYQYDVMSDPNTLKIEIQMLKGADGVGYAHETHNKEDLVFAALSDMDNVYICKSCSTHMNFTTIPAHAKHSHNRSTYKIEGK